MTPKRDENREDVPGNFKSGFVALVGRPNVGKSTLLNRVVGETVAITTNRPQTTRMRVRGIVNREQSQIVLLDTPGIHLPPGSEAKGGKAAAKTRAINRFMVSEAEAALSEVDLCIQVIEAHGRGRLPAAEEEDSLVLKVVEGSGCPALLAVNKTDLLKDKKLILPVLAAYNETGIFKELVPISARTGEGIESLLTAVESLLSEGPRYFPPDMITDQPERELAAEFIRQQVILQSREEIPFATAVEVYSFEDKPDKNLVVIHATLFVERESQKGILIGKKGGKLKSIGSRARKSIESMLSCKVFLDLRVKVKSDWSKTAGGLRSVGYDRR